MYNADNQDTNPLRDFTFNFRVIVDGVENIITKEVSLNNVQQFYDLITVNNVPGSTVTYGPSGSIPVVPTAPSTIPVRARRDESGDIVNIKAKNGANNPNLQNQSIVFKQPANLTQAFEYVIFSQTINSIDGPPATLIDSDTNVFKLEPSLPSDGLEGRLKLTNSNSNLVRAALYFVTIRIQDAGLIAEDVTFEIDMRIRLSGGPYNDNVADSGNVFNAALRVDFINRIGQFGVNWAGVPSDYWVGDQWYYLPATLLKIDSSVAGITASEAGYYLYASGVFNNEYGWVSGSNGHPASYPSLCSLNGVNANDGTINIPLNTPDPVVGLVQQQTLWPDATNPNVPLVKGKATVLSAGSSGNSIIVTIDPLASTTQGEIKKDMSAFTSFPVNSPLPEGGYGDANSPLRIKITNIMRARVNSYNSSTGVMSIRNTGELSLPVGATIYFFGGNHQDKKPWYFSPNTDLNSLRRIQAYFWYSEWNFLKPWQNGGNFFGPKGYGNSIPNFNDTYGGMNPNPNDPGGQGLNNIPDFIDPDDLDNITFTIS